MVLITEKFDESMVLLAIELCWPLEYVKSFKLNARKSSTKTKLSEKEQNILENWQQGDLLLYNHFKTIFEGKVGTILSKIIITTTFILLSIFRNLQEKPNKIIFS